MTNEEKAKEIAGFQEGVNPIPVQRFVFDKCIEMASWKDQQFWSKENIEKIIITYKSFPDRSCPNELIKKTIEKLKKQE